MSRDSEIVIRDVTNAGLVVSDRISRDLASQLDLEEALEASRYTSHPYSAHPREWPPLVEVLDTWELPSVLIERYNAAGGEGTALCGIFPEIHRAWASVDNSLFLWRFDKWETPQMINVLKEMKDGLDKVTSKIQLLTAKVKADCFPTRDGISYLEAKHLLLLNYCQSLVYYLLRKAKGLSIDGHPVVQSLVEIRLFLEKVRPIDKKLQYQIQKITRVMENADEQPSLQENKSDENGKSEDLLQYRPNPEMIIEKENPKDGIYRPPILLPVQMEDDKISKKDRNARRKDEDMLRRAKGNDYINSLIDESMGRPEEVRETMGVESREHKRYIEKMQRRAEEEEENFIRAPISKADKQKLKRLEKSRNGLSGLTESLFDDIKSMPLEFDEPEQAGGSNNSGRLDRSAKRRKRRH